MSNLEGRIMEIIQSGQREKQTNKKDKNNVRGFWDNSKHTKIHIPLTYGGPRKRREKGVEIIFDEIMAEHFLNMKKETDIQVQESGALRVSNKINLKRAIPWHIIIKLVKFKNKERILKAAWENERVRYQEPP